MKRTAGISGLVVLGCALAAALVLLLGALVALAVSRCSRAEAREPSIFSRCTTSGCYDALPKADGTCPVDTHPDVQHSIGADHPGDFTRTYCHRDFHTHPHPRGLECAPDRFVGYPPWKSEWR